MELGLSDWRHLRYPIIVVGALLLLPLYRVGIFNDFTMRASIPALTLVAIAAASGATEAKGYRWIPLAVLLTIGSAASVLEIIGRGREGRVVAQGQSLRSGFLFDDPRFFAQHCPRARTPSRTRPRSTPLLQGRPNSQRLTLQPIRPSRR